MSLRQFFEIYLKCLEKVIKDYEILEKICTFFPNLGNMQNHRIRYTIVNLMRYSGFSFDKMPKGEKDVNKAI